MFFIAFLSLYYSYLNAYMGRTLNNVSYVFGSYTDYFVYAMMALPLSALDPMNFIALFVSFIIMFAPSLRSYLPFLKMKDWFPVGDWKNKLKITAGLWSRYAWASVPFSYIVFGDLWHSIAAGFVIAYGYLVASIMGGNDLEGKLNSGFGLGMLTALTLYWG